MIGALPKSLDISGKSYEIRSDFRAVLVALVALNDKNLTETERCIAAVKCIVKSEIPPLLLNQAIKAVFWFINGGKDTFEGKSLRLYDWEQDEKMIFSAVNRVAGFETREKTYLHWWTFLGYFCEVGEGMFATVVSIRKKLKTHKKLEKHEREFYKENRRLIDLTEKLSDEELEKEQADRDFIKNLTKT